MVGFLYILAAFVIFIVVATIAFQWRMGKHRGVSREEFIATFDAAIPTEIPAAVYDYYKKGVILVRTFNRVTVLVAHRRMIARSAGVYTAVFTSVRKTAKLLMSVPTARLPSALASTIVVPPPMKGSYTASPGSVNARITALENCLQFFCGAERIENGRPRYEFSVTVSCKSSASIGIWLREPSPLTYSIYPSATQ